MRLTVREPGGPERRVEVGAGAFSVGRDRDCDLVLADTRASRRHAVIEGGPDGIFTVRDLASSNGTTVNGHKIADPVELHDGERITIGSTTLTVADAAASSPPRPRRAIEHPSHQAPSARSWTRRKILLLCSGAVLALLVLALVVAQLTLPGIATSRLRDSLKTHGIVRSVSVSAFPAITLLWHHADSVTVRMATYTDPPSGGSSGASQGAVSQPRSGPQKLADFLASTSATDSLDARVGRLMAGRLALDSVVLTKTGSQLSASAYASDSEIRAALPSSLALRSFASGGGELVFTGVASLFGRHAVVRMRLLAKNGALVVQPDLGPFLPSVLSLTVFKDPRVYVESVAAQPAPGGFDVSAQARLTG